MHNKAEHSQCRAARYGVRAAKAPGRHRIPLIFDVADVKVVMEILLMAK
jgi:hypothetical protein